MRTTFRRTAWLPIAVYALLSVPIGHAEVFQNKFLRLRLPDGWHSVAQIA